MSRFVAFIVVLMALGYTPAAAAGTSGGSGTGGGCCEIDRLFPNEPDEIKAALTEIQARLRVLPDHDLRFLSFFDNEICEQFDYCGIAAPKQVNRLVAAIVSERRQLREDALSLASINSQSTSNWIALAALVVSSFAALFSGAAIFLRQKKN